MGEEKNRATLERALAQLRTYGPAPRQWEEIKARLDDPAIAREENLQRAVEHLPGYTPPPTVWNAINHSLDVRRKERKVVRLRRTWAYRVAAGLAIVLFAAWWLLRDSPAKVEIHYSQETVAQFNITPDWNTEADAFDQLQGQLVAINDPTLNNLRLEMEELTSAKEEVEAMLSSYGQDPRLVRQLSEIERERSEVYRQIIEYI